MNAILTHGISLIAGYFAGKKQGKDEEKQQQYKFPLAPMDDCPIDIRVLFHERTVVRKGISTLIPARWGDRFIYQIDKGLWNVHFEGVPKEIVQPDYNMIVQVMDTKEWWNPTIGFWGASILALDYSGTADIYVNGKLIWAALVGQASGDCVANKYSVKYKISDNKVPK